MVAAEKFDQADRRAVIRKVEKTHGVSLTPVGRRRKWLKDDSGRSYWVLGGYGEWHGIPKEMMDAEVEAPSGGFLVVAVRGESAMAIYVGPLTPFVKGRAKLFRTTRTKDYQFTFKRRGTKIIVDQIPSAILTDLVGFEYSKDMKASDIQVEEVRRLIESLTEEEKSEILKMRRQQQQKE